MTDTNKSVAEAINEITDESLGTADVPEDGEVDEGATDATTEATEEGGEEQAEEGTEEGTDEAAEDEEEVAEAEEEPDFFDNLTPDQLQAIKNNPELNSLRKGLLKGYETKTTELKQLVQLGEAWKQNPRGVVQALAQTLNLTVAEAKAVAEQAGAAATAAAAAAPQPDPLDAAGKELEALFGTELGPRVRAVFDKWADARTNKALQPLQGKLGQVEGVVGQQQVTNEQNRMLSEEQAFKAKHKDLSPDTERRIVELGNSGKFRPGPGQTPAEFLEALHDIATAQIARETAKKAAGTASKKLASRIQSNRQDREPVRAAGPRGASAPSKISQAKSISEALDIAEAELRAEGL